MDDFDDLLDEIEREFAQKEKSAPAKVIKTTKAPQQTRREQKKGETPLHEWDDIDKEIDDILDPGEEVPNGNELSKIAKKSEKSDCQNTKCFPLQLGGFNMPRGFSVGRQKKACNNLRCTSCDFEVQTFDNCQWHSGADYLFFRNTMPDRSKLQAKLRKSQGCVAYCCQCSWKSINQPTAMSQFKDLKWVCGKH